MPIDVDPVVDDGDDLNDIMCLNLRQEVYNLLVALRQ